MNNLKRVLSLGLTGAMLSGMMLVGASAADYKDFTDKAEIQHTEAVSTMTLLGVIAGKDTGAFDPEGIVTRAEMAKMITVALHGGKDPVLGIKSTPTYADIKGHWAESYIEYCSSQGIISGVGDGNFAPDATVTGSQAAKMMLTAMGYDAIVYNFTGVDWEINVNAEANKADVELYAELDDLNPSDGLSRDAAAQLVYNGIQAPTMTKTPSKTVANGEVEYTYNLNGKPLLKSAFKVDTNYGQLVNIDEGRLSINFDPNYVNKSTGSLTSFTKLTTDYTEYLGQTVKVLYKANDEVVGVAPVDDNQTYTVALSSIENSDGKVKFDGTKYVVEHMSYTGSASAGYNITNTEKTIDTITIAHDGTLSTGTATIPTLVSGKANQASYNTVTFVDNDGDGNLEYAVIVEKVPGKVTYSNSDEIIAGGTTYDRDDDTIADDVAKDDYVVASYNRFNANYDVEKVEKGTATAAINNKAGLDLQYQFDGTWYYRGNASLTDTVTAGDTYDFYAYNGVIVNTELSKTATTLTNLAMVVRKVSNMDNQVKLIFTDGSTKVVSAVPDDYTTNDRDYSALAVGQLYTVSETSKGYSFKELNSTVASGNVQKIGDYTFANGASADVVASASKIASIGGQVIADNAIIFVYAGSSATNGEAKIITGKQLKGLDAHASTSNLVNDTSNGYFTSKVNGLTRATVAAVKMNGTTLPAVGASNENYGLIVSNGYQLDGTYAQYDLWTGTEMLTVKEKVVLSAGDRQKFDIITYDNIKDGVVEDVVELTQSYTSVVNTAPNVGIAAAVSVESGKLWLSNSASVERNNDTVYMYYDSSASDADKIGKDSGELVKADSAASGVLVPNIKYVADGTDLKFVLVDVKNKIADSEAKAAAGITATNGTVSTGVSASFSKTTSILMGETLTMTITVAPNATLPAGNLTLTNAVSAVDGTATIAVAGYTNTTSSNKTFDYSVVATTAGAISVTHSAPVVLDLGTIITTSNAAGVAITSVAVKRGSTTLTQGSSTLNPGETLTIVVTLTDGTATGSGATVTLGSSGITATGTATAAQTAGATTGATASAITVSAGTVTGMTITYTCTVDAAAVSATITPTITVAAV